jgi:hypothetical protein
MRTIMKRRMRHTSAGWALRLGLWVHGLDDPVEYVNLLREYTLQERRGLIRCPTLFCRAENDDTGVTAPKLTSRPVRKHL